MSITELRKVLVHAFPNDIIMPVEKGLKHPMFPHKCGAWTHKSYEKWWNETEAQKIGPRTKLRFTTESDFDYCLLLHDICVVDVDNHELVTTLVHRFPELTDTLAVETCRGKHFYFRRPDKADEHGYYDGAGQRIKGVDFKSVCANGTSGIIMVPPSTNKRWTDPDYCTRLVNIPFISMELLSAIAVPRHHKITATLRFECGNTLHVEGCTWLASMSYFDAFFGTDAIFEVDVVSVPCDMATFQDLMFALSNKCVPYEQPSTELLSRLLALADKLGLLSLRMLKTQVKYGVLMTQVAMHDLHKKWWHLLYEEIRLGLNMERLIVVDEDLAKELMFTPIDKMDKECWLFPETQPKLATFSPTLHPHPEMAVMEACDHRVIKLMSRFPGKVVLAGGKVVGAVCTGCEPGYDHDMFIIGDEAFAQSVLDEAKTMFPDVEVVSTGNAVTMIDKTTQDKVSAQIIMRLFSTPAEVVASFDIAPCKVAAWFEGDRLVVRAAPSWVETVRTMSFPVDLSIWGRASISRVMKYIAKGFDAAIPGLPRTALRKNCSNIAGVGELYYIESFLNRFGTRLSGKRPTFRDVMRATRGHLQSDYGVLLKTQRRIFYAVQGWIQAVRSAARSVLGIPINNGWSQDLSNIRWIHINKNRQDNIFRPMSPLVYNCFDVTRL